MKRDPRLRGLSSDHHHALVLARRLAALVDAGQLDEAARRLAEGFARELEPHFGVEEAHLLPALRVAGELTLVERTAADHAALRALARAGSAGERAAVLEFAARLTDHVRFEERELFPCCEGKLPAAVLDAIGHSPQSNA